MKIMVLGGGGREHAILWKLSQSCQVNRLYAAPGNGGTIPLAPTVPIPPEEHEKLIGFAKREQMDLVVAGPEAPLVAGIADAFTAEGIEFCGPTKAGARLEGSKIWAKEFMQRHGIPTANFRVYDDAAAAGRSLSRRSLPLVIKADGLAAGKGVLIARTRAEALEAVETLMVRGRLGRAGKKIVVEEYLEGEELSILAVTDGEEVVMLPPSQDHKRVGEGDTGLNTGGMGAYAPAPLYDDPSLQEAVESQIITPTIEGLQDEGIVYRGILYFGIMVTPAGPQVLEYNCRFGDPETQAVLPLISADLATLLSAAAAGNLREWREENDVLPSPETADGFPRAALCVVLASGGYPGKYETGYPVEGIDSAGSLPGAIVFHAGTRQDAAGRTITSGGRVLGVTGTGSDLREAAVVAYEAVKRISFPDMYLRRDIGSRALGEVPSGA